MAPATPFRFCVMQNSLTIEKNKAFKDLAYYSEWPKVAGAVIKAEGWVRIIHRRHRCDLSLFQLGMRLLEHFLNEDLPIPVAFHIFI